MPIRLFHRTTPGALTAILADGFRDGEDGGVWFALYLDDWGVRGRSPIEVILDVSEEALAQYVVEALADEELDDVTGEFVKVTDDSQIERFHWYQIPAALVNVKGIRRALGPGEVRRLDLDGE